MAWPRKILPGFCEERRERYLQLSFEDKKSYIANLSLMGEIYPWNLLNGGSVFPRFDVAFITEVSDFKVASYSHQA